jgi:hypothetical protein
MSKCPRKNKHCKCTLLIKARGNNFICSGINSKPTKYKGDAILLCLSGEISNRCIEMTQEEAAYIAAVLCTNLGYQLPGIPLKQNATHKKKE